MSFDNAYESITEENDDTHWAFGTGFDDPLAGVERELPSHVDSADLTAYCLMLADDALVLSQRLTEWCSRAVPLPCSTIQRSFTTRPMTVRAS